MIKKIALISWVLSEFFVRTVCLKVPFVSTFDCEMFGQTLAQHGDLSCLCSSRGGGLMSDAPESRGSSEKATWRGCSPLAAVCSSYHIPHFLPGFTDFPPPAFLSPSQLHSEVRPAERRDQFCLMWHWKTWFIWKCSEEWKVFQMLKYLTA